LACGIEDPHRCVSDRPADRDRRVGLHTLDGRPDRGLGGAHKRFHSALQRASSRAASSAGSGSPPHSATRLAAPVQPAASSMLQVAGVACITVGRTAARRSISSCGSAASSRVASSTRAPTGEWQQQPRPRCRTTAWSRPAACRRPTGRLALHRRHEVQQRSVFDLHTLGAARRARGVEHVGESRAPARFGGALSGSRQSTEPAHRDRARGRVRVRVGRPPRCAYHQRQTGVLDMKCRRSRGNAGRAGHTHRQPSSRPTAPPPCRGCAAGTVRPTRRASPRGVAGGGPVGWRASSSSV